MRNDAEILPAVMRKLTAIINSGYNLEPSFVDERLRRMLAKLPEDSGIEALNEFERALRANREKIMNPSGYLLGVVRRLLEAIELKNFTPESIGEYMTPLVNQKLQHMIDLGIFTKDDVDGRCRNMLKQLSENEVISALDEVLKADRSRISNISGYLMGVLKRFRNRKENQMLRIAAERRGNVNSGINVSGGGNIPGAGLNAPTVGGNYGGKGISSGHPTIPAELLDPLGFLPAPDTIPMELLYGYGIFIYLYNTVYI